MAEQPPPCSRDNTVDEIIFRFLQGHATEVERMRLRRWRQESVENEAYFEWLKGLWEATERVDGAGEPLPSPPTAVELLSRLERRRRSEQRRRNFPKVAYGVGIAAAVAAIALGSSWLLESIRTREPDTVTATTFVAGRTESSTVTLGDGSVVRIAPGGRLRVALDATSRTVWLDGKAYFAVAKKEGWPFSVHTRAGSARVLGTRFEVRAEDEELRVVVVEGRVALSATEGTVEVGAGEMSRVTTGARPTIMAVDNLVSELAWLDGFLAFQATPLWQVARELEAQYGARILISDPELAERTVTATFVDRGLEDVLLVVCGVVTARCTIRDSVVRIDP